MRKMFYNVLFMFSIFFMNSCIDIYDIKNPNIRKQLSLKDIILAELYLRETNDDTFSPNKTGRNPYQYITREWGICEGDREGKLYTYKRNDMPINQFKNDVPEIISNMKNTIFYNKFKDYKDNHLNPFNFTISNMIRFIDNDQKNISVTKITDNYICVSIKY